jgi:hypothetical protein
MLQKREQAPKCGSNEEGGENINGNKSTKEIILEKTERNYLAQDEVQYRTL